MQLNDKQRQAVNATEGPVMVIAPPGSGKTTTLTQRIAYMLLSESQIDPRTILCLTFTDTGAVTMRNKLIETIGETAYKVNINTIHGFCNEIIRDFPDVFGVRDFEVITDLEKIEIAYKIIDDLPENHLFKRYRGDIYYDARKLLKLFDLMKSEGWGFNDVVDAGNKYIQNLPFDEKFIYKRANAKKEIKVGDIKTILVQKEKEKILKLNAAASLLERYDFLMREKNRYDYNDMLFWVLKAWDRKEFFKLIFQERYQYLLLDESQDTSGRQFEVIYSLMDYWDNPNIFIVGDLDQTIFQFAGARLRNILDFKAKYDPLTIILDINYRSMPQIVKYSNKLIAHNTERINNLMTDSLVMKSNYTGTGEVKIIEYNNVKQQTAHLINVLENNINNLSGYAVIYRKHRQADDLIHQLQARGIPFNIKRQVNVMQTMIIKQLIEILSLIDSYYQLDEDGYNQYLFRILHFEFFNVNTDKVHHYYLSLQDKQSRSRKPADMIKVEAFIKESIDIAYNNPPLYLIQYIIEYSNILHNLIDENNRITQMQYLNAFVDWVNRENLKNPDLELSDIPEMLSKMRSNDISLPLIDIIGDSRGVSLMTAHGAKGTEFDVVHILGATANEWEKSRSGQNEFSLPPTLTSSTGEDKIESNRRLFYVAMTRAKKELIISYAKLNDQGKELYPSQFVTELGIQPEKVSVNDVLLMDFLRVNIKTGKTHVLTEDQLLTERLENLTMSVTSLNKYLECPLRFYFEDIIRVPFKKTSALVFGVAIHYVMKKIYDAAKKEKNEVNLDMALGLFYDYMEKNKGKLSSKEFNLKTFYGKQVLKTFFNDYFQLSNKITINEYRIRRISIGDVPFKADLDKMEFEGNSVVVVDYKTGNPDSAKRKAKPGGDYWRQGLLYKMALDHTVNNWRFKGFRIDTLTDKEVLSIPVWFELRDEVEMEKLLKEVYGKIMNKEFTGCGKEDCVWCGMVGNC